LNVNITPTQRGGLELLCEAMGMRPSQVARMFIQRGLVAEGVVPNPAVTIANRLKGANGHADAKAV
jgi:hypothetical protein